jgi:hypothetical protein
MKKNLKCEKLMFSFQIPKVEGTTITKLLARHESTLM